MKPGNGLPLSLSLYHRLTRRARASGQESAQPAARRPAGPVVWLHAATETQAIALLELAQRLAQDRDELWFLLTVTSAGVKSRLEAHLLASPLAQTVVLLFVGDDARIARHWRPDICVWTGGPTHPALLTEIARTAEIMILADAEARRPVQQGMLRLPGLRRAVFGLFDLIFAADRENAGQFTALGLDPKRISQPGRLREGTSPPGCYEAERDAIAALLATRPLWLAANCVPEECQTILDAHQIALRTSHRLLLILIPFDKSLGKTVMREAEAAGFSVGLRSAGQEPEPDMQVYVADFPGEAGLWYRLSPTCFVGQTLASGKAPQPWDPAALGSAILFGPRMQTARSAFELLENRGAALRVSDSATLAEAVVSLLAPDKAAHLAHNAWMTITEGAEVLDRLTDAITAGLDATTTTDNAAPGHTGADHADT